MSGGRKNGCCAVCCPGKTESCNPAEERLRPSLQCPLLPFFPGEAEAYAGRAGWEIRKTARGDLLLCSGTCNREERPLSCRLFPLLPLIGDDGEIRVVTDQRARAVCPLARQGKSAMDPAFIEAVRQAGEILAAQDEQAVFLDMLEEEQNELKDLRKQLSMKK